MTPEEQAQIDAAIKAAQAKVLAQSPAAGGGASSGKSVVFKDEEAVSRSNAQRLQKQMDDATWEIKRQRKGVGETISDVGSSAATGFSRGMMAIPGSPVDIVRLGQLSRAYANSKGWGGDKSTEGRPWEGVLAQQDAEREVNNSPLRPSVLNNWGGEAWANAALGEDTQEPSTYSGKIAKGGGEVVGGMLPGTLVGGVARGAGAIARNTRGLAGLYGAVRGEAGRTAGDIVRQGIIPGAAIGTTQQVTDNPAIQMGVGAAASIGASRDPSMAQKKLSSAVEGATPQHHAAAEALFMEAHQRGIPITRLQALDQVTNGLTAGTELQRVIESSGNPTLRRFFANSNEGVRAEGNRMIDQIAPEPTQPGMLGNVAPEQAQAQIDTARRGVNADVRPEYQRFERDPVDPQVLQAARDNPYWAQIYDRLAQDPRLQGSDLAPPGTVGFMDIVNRVMRDEREGMMSPQAQGGPQPTMAEAVRPQLESGQQVANMASRQLQPGQGVPVDPVTGQPVPSPLEVAQQHRAEGEAQRVTPLEMGPEGRVANAKTAEGVIGGVFPNSPAPGSHHEVGRMIGALSQENPDTARQIVRQYLAQAFNAATGANIPGEPYTGGAKFWKNVSSGDPQRAANLDAALRNLPGGDTLADGFQRFGTIMQAMGKRQPPGSKTAFNAEDLADMRQNGIKEGAVKTMAGLGLTWPQQVKDVFENFRLGQNKEMIAQAITDPRQAENFRLLATVEPGSAAAVRVVERIVTSLAKAGMVAREAEEQPGAGPMILRNIKPRGTQ